MRIALNCRSVNLP